MTEQIITKLAEKVDGKFWQKGEVQRVYIEPRNVFARLVGKLNEIYWDGGRAEMSKNTERSLWGNLGGGKIWYNLVDNKFYTKYVSLPEVPYKKLSELLRELIEEV